MRSLLCVSAAVLLLSGSLASADDPFVPNDNDRMQALSTVIGHGVDRQVWYGAQIVTATSNGGAASRGFLLGSDENDHKAVINQWNGAAATARHYSVMTGTSEAGGPLSRGFLLHSTDSDGKRIENQYAR